LLIWRFVFLIKEFLDLATENPGKQFLFTISGKEIQFCDVPGVEIIHIAIQLNLAIKPYKKKKRKTKASFYTCG
jgi:hypothetical protein